MRYETKKGAPPTIDATARQFIRKERLHAAMDAVNWHNMRTVSEGRHVGMKRADRRKLARAYAKKTEATA